MTIWASKVLVVDDNEVNYQLVEFILSDMGVLDPELKRRRSA